MQKSKEFAGVISETMKIKSCPNDRIISLLAALELKDKSLARETRYTNEANVSEYLSLIVAAATEELKLSQAKIDSVEFTYRKENQV